MFTRTGRNAAVSALILFIFYSALFSNNPTNYTVRCSQCWNRPFGERTSYFEVTSSDRSFQMINTANQRIISVRKGPSSSTILIKTGDLKLEKESAGLEKYLADTVFLNLASPEIKNAANSIPARGNILNNVASFVRNRIDRPTLGIPFLPARDILKDRAGDCTEYSILTIALLRSLKIPARAVVGMIYTEEFNGHRNAFVYHMWVEAFHENRWHLVDAANDISGIHNRYIAFTYHNLKTESPLSYMRALSTIRDLKVRYNNRR